jgi:type IV pilus biogenesis protein CpaD/CtpE
MISEVSDMYRNRSNLMAPPALALAAALLSGCASDGLFAEDDVYRPYSGSELHPIKLVNGRAHVDHCGSWPEDAGDTWRNELSANHGCAVQTNIAAMAADPRDVVGKGKPLAPPLGEISSLAIDKVTAKPSDGSQ